MAGKDTCAVQSARQFASSLDLLPARVAIVLDHQFALRRLQLLEAMVEALEALFANRHRVARHEADGARDRHVADSRLVERHMFALAPEILQQDEPRDDITVTRRRPGRDLAALLQRAADPVERFVRKLVCGGAVPPIEVRHQAAAHLEVPFAVRVDAVVQPLEQSVECEFRKFRFFSKDFLC